MIVALNQVLTDFESGELYTEQVKPLIGRGVSAMIQAAFLEKGRALSENKLDQAIQLYLEYYRASPTRYSRLYKGVPIVLKTLKDRKVKMGVCSNKAGEMVKLILESFRLDGYFCAITGGDNFKYNKPDGRHILKTLGLMKVASLNVLMVGDTLTDFLAANDAGVNAVIDNYGYSDPQEFAPQKLIITDIREILNLG